MSSWVSGFLASAASGWDDWFFDHPLFKEPLLFVLTAVVVGSLVTGRDRSSRGCSSIVALAVTIAGFGVLYGARTVSNVIDPPEWHMMAYWLSAKVALAGHDFYSPASFHQVAQAIGWHPHDPQIRPLLLDVGFTYPPQTMLAIAALGLLRPQTASLVWCVFQYVGLVLSTVMLSSLLLGQPGKRGVAAALALLFLLYPTYATIAAAQTSFFVLAGVLAFAVRPESARAGIYLALAAALQPMVGALFLYPLLRRHLRPLLSGITTLLALSLATAALFGAGQFTSYFLSHPMSRLPVASYTAEANQSLLGYSLRLRARPDASLIDPAYVIALLLIAAVTAVAVRSLTPSGPAEKTTDFREGERDRWSIATIICAVLLVWPQSWDYQAVLLALPIFVVLRDHAELQLTPAVCTGLITVVYALVRYDHGSISMVGTAALWLVLLRATQRVNSRSGRGVSGVAIEQLPWRR